MVFSRLFELRCALNLSRTFSSSLLNIHSTFLLNQAGFEAQAGSRIYTNPVKITNFSRAVPRLLAGVPFPRKFITLRTRRERERERVENESSN